MEIRIKIVKLFERANTIGTLMQLFHSGDEKSQSLLLVIQKRKKGFDQHYKENNGVPLIGLNSLNDELLDRIKQALPPSPWPKNVHKNVASIVGITNKLSHKGINELVKRGMFPLQKINEQDP